MGPSKLFLCLLIVGCGGRVAAAVEIPGRPDARAEVGDGAASGSSSGSDSETTGLAGDDGASAFDLEDGSLDAELGTGQTSAPEGTTGDGSSYEQDASTGAAPDGGTGIENEHDAGTDAGGLLIGIEAGVECQSAADCSAQLGQTPMICVDSCPDTGEQDCLHYVCVSGVCGTTYCGSGASTSNSECQTVTDCENLLGELPVVCILSCSNSGAEGCLHYECLSGICQTTYCD